MTGKNALHALFVVVLMGSVAGAALADDQGMNMYGPADSSVSAQPGQGMEQSAEGEIREPVETGAVPEWSERSSDPQSNPSGEAPTVEYGGQTFRPGIDTGP